MWVLINTMYGTLILLLAAVVILSTIGILMLEKLADYFNRPGKGNMEVEE
jgi:hypothetical protein